MGGGGGHFFTPSSISCEILKHYEDWPVMFTEHCKNKKRPVTNHTFYKRSFIYCPLKCLQKVAIKTYTI